MAQWHNTRTDDVIDVPDALDAQYKENKDWEPHKAPAKAKASNTGSGSN